MAPILHTPRVEVTGSTIVSRGSNRNVIRSASDDLSLFMYVTMDETLWDEPLPVFVASFRIWRVGTGEISNHYWVGELASLPRGRFLWLLWSWGRAEWAGVSRGGWEPPAEDGLYCFRPAISIYQSTQPAVFYLDGLSHYAVGEEHFFMVERNPLP